MTTTIDVDKIRKDFPILDQSTNGNKLVFLDSAASSQRPKQVIDAMSHFYENDYANVHRGVYDLAMRSSNAYENARKSTANFINANSPNEIVFTKNATESINLVASSWGKQNLKEKDVVVLTMLEHHANIVPWQMLATQIGIEIRWIPVNENGILELSNLDNILKGAKLLAFTSMSNVTGTITQSEQLIASAKAQGCLTLVDGCQWVPHFKTDVKALDCDFFAFSSHKMLGPSGIGALYVKESILDSMQPFLGGGGMIENVSLEGFTSAKGPAKFEAGTPPIAEAVGMHAAIDYLKEIGFAAIKNHEAELTKYALDEFKKIDKDLKIFGPQEPSDRGAVFSFELNNIHAHDVSQVLNEHGICVRPGHHCAKPLMKYFGTTATVRASFYLYNDFNEIDALIDGLEATKDFFKN